MGGIFVGNALTFFVSLQYVSAATATVILCTYPALVAIGARFFYSEKFTLLKFISVVLAFAGCVAVVGGPTPESAKGMLYAFLASCFYTAYILVGRRVQTNTDPLAQATIVSVVAAVVLGVLAFQSGLTLPSTTLGWSSSIGLAVISTVIAITAFQAGTARLSSTEAATLSLTEPVFVAILAASFLDEPLHAGTIVGTVMIIVSALLILRGG
jgi:drug/metabolite transporter (DMT)-like permease